MAKKNVGEVVKIRKDLNDDTVYLMIPAESVTLAGNVPSIEAVLMAGQELVINEICTDCGQYIINGEHFTDEMFEGYEAPKLAVGDFVKVVDDISIRFPYKVPFHPVNLLEMKAVFTAEYPIVGKIMSIDEDGLIRLDIPKFEEAFSELEGVDKYAPVSPEMLYKITEGEYEAQKNEVAVSETPDGSLN